MAQGVLLGSIQFVQREVPDIMPFGGLQKLAIQRQMGGNRVVDAMGPDPHPIRWSGHFYTLPNISASASTRARQVDALRQSGQQVWLYWGSFSYLVVVADFHADYKHEWEIPYHIAVEVIQDGPIQPFQPTFDQSVNSDLQALAAKMQSAVMPGQTIFSSTMITSAQNAMSVMNTAVGNGSLDQLSLTQIQPIVNAFTDTFNTFQAGAVSPTGINLDAIPSGAVIDGINALNTEATAIVGESTMQEALSILARIIANLSSFGG